MPRFKIGWSGKATQKSYHLSKDPKEVKEGAKEISMENVVQVNSACTECILYAILPRWGQPGLESCHGRR